MTTPSLAHLGWPALSKRDADRVLRIVRGQNGDDCQRDADILGAAALSVQWIKRKRAGTRSAGKRKAALRKVADNIRAVIKSIEDLPIATQYELDPVFSELPIETKNSLVSSALSPKALRTQALTNGVQQWALQPGTLQQFLNRVLDRTLALADEIKVTRSGGKQSGPGGGRVEAAQKRAAADCALNILLASGRREPNLTRGGPYLELATLLFELATGKKDRDLERACTYIRGRSKPTARADEMWEMLFESDGVPKVFEDND